jgi:hypothetical protein
MKQKLRTSDLAVLDDGMVSELLGLLKEKRVTIGGRAMVKEVILEAKGLAGTNTDQSHVVETNAEAAAPTVADAVSAAVDLGHGGSDNGGDHRAKHSNVAAGGGEPLGDDDDGGGDDDDVEDGGDDVSGPPQIRSVGAQRATGGDPVPVPLWAHSR